MSSEHDNQDKPSSEGESDPERDSRLILLEQLKLLHPRLGLDEDFVLMLQAWGCKPSGKPVDAVFFEQSSKTEQSGSRPTVGLGIRQAGVIGGAVTPFCEEIISAQHDKVARKDAKKKIDARYKAARRDSQLFRKLVRFQQLLESTNILEPSSKAALIASWAGAAETILRHHLNRTPNQAEIKHFVEKGTGRCYALQEWTRVFRLPGLSHIERAPSWHMTDDEAAEVEECVRAFFSGE